MELPTNESLLITMYFEFDVNPKIIEAMRRGIRPKVACITRQWEGGQLGIDVECGDDWVFIPFNPGYDVEEAEVLMRRGSVWFGYPYQDVTISVQWHDGMALVEECDDYDDEDIYDDDDSAYDADDYDNVDP